MTLKEKVFEYIQKYGPQTNADLVAKFKVLKASVRRTCGELLKEGKISPVPSKDKRLWGIASDAREPVATKTTKAAKSAMPAPSLPDKKSEPPLDPKDWRMTDFTF
jgi:hypothetical protein